jgi:hypothetical protein
MGYRSAADGIAKSGKTKGTNLGNSGPTASIQSGKGSSSACCATGEAMKKVGRNMARANNQKG